MRRRLPLLLLLVFASGCGGTSATTTATKSTAAPAPAPAKAVGERTVTIKNFDFHPPTLTVPKGTTVRWVNRDASNHTVTGEAGARIKLGNVDQGKHVQMRFTTRGTYKYYCEYHPNMHARIVVR